MPSFSTYQPRDEHEVVARWTRVFGYPEPRNDPRFALRLEHAHGDGLLQLERAADGTLLATGMGGYDGHRAWLYGLAVAPQLRRQGLGRAMVEHLERLLVARGARKINLQLRAGNEAVAAFYERLGYHLEPRASMGRVLDTPAPDAIDDDARVAIRIEPYREPHEAAVTALWNGLFAYHEPRNDPREPHASMGKVM